MPDSAIPGRNCISTGLSSHDSAQRLPMWRDVSNRLDWLETAFEEITPVRSPLPGGPGTTGRACVMALRMPQGRLFRPVPMT